MSSQIKNILLEGLINKIKISDSCPEPELLLAFRGQDAIINTIATSSSKIQERFIDIAIKAGVKRFIHSTFGSDVRNEKARDLFPSFLQGKFEIVEYLKGKEGQSIFWTSFVTGPVFDLSMAFGYMGFNIKEMKAVIYDDISTPWFTTTLAYIGLDVKNAMLISEKTANQYLFLDSFTVFQKYFLAAFEKTSGQKWEVTHAVLKNDKKEGLEKMQKGDFTMAANLIRYINLTPWHGGNYMEYEEGANELLSLSKETLDEVVSGLCRFLGVGDSRKYSASYHTLAPDWVCLYSAGLVNNEGTIKY